MLNGGATAKAGTNNKFWRFENKGGGDAELLIYGEIAETSWFGDEVTPREFKDELDGLGSVKNITVRINSGGGDVFAAQAIGNVLEQHGAKVTAHIDGLCASAATIIACHCDSTEAAADTTYMIHPIKVGLCGYLNAQELEQYKRELDSLRENVIDLYARKTGQSKEDCAAWMDATSWWTAAEAQEKGFVDEIISAKSAAKVENRGGVLFVNSIDTKLPFESAPDVLQTAARQNAAGGQADNTKPTDTPANDPNEEGKNMEIKTVEDARKAYPELMNQLETEAKNAAAAEATTAATAAERKRMQEIDAVAKLYDEALVNEAKYGEHACDAKELTYRAALADAKRGAAYLEQRAKDTQESGVKGVGSEPPADKKPDAANSPAEAAAEGSKDGKMFMDMLKKGRVK